MFFLICQSAIVFAEIPIGTLLTHTKTEISNDNILVYNDQKDQLPPISGLELFPGDRLDTQSEEAIILIPANSLIITAEAYTKLEFQLLELGGMEFVIQVIVRSGNVFLDIHNSNDLLQILDDISAPQQVERNDVQKTDIDFAKKVYTQVINVNADVISRNVDYSTEVFVTGVEFDIKKLIDSLKVRDTKNNVSYLFNLPEVRTSFQFSNELLLSLYMKDDASEQYVNGIYRFNMFKSKLDMTFQLPFLFTRDNLVYNPFGENDLNFGARAADAEFESMGVTDKLILGLDHAVRNLLKKIYKIQYGSEEDNLYFFYGNQYEWNNYKSTMFAYHYKPVSTLENNFNQDAIFEYNGYKIGNELRLRQFQPSSYSDVFFSNYNVLFNRVSFSPANFDLLYNRFWYRPAIPLNATEIGLSVGADMSVGKLSSSDTDPNTSSSTFNKYYVAFAGLDITTPFVTGHKYRLEMNFEAGSIFPFAEKGFLSQSTFTNYAGKLGFRNTFFLDKYNTQIGFQFNGYYTAGFMRPHFAMDGYEYSSRFFYTRSMSAMDQAGNSGSAISGNTIHPEFEVFTNGDVVEAALGAYYPIDLGASENLYQLPAAFVNFSVNLNPFLPPILKMSIDGRYAVQNLAISDFGNSIDQLFENNPFSISYNIMFKNLIGLKASFFNTPFYDSNGALSNFNSDRGNSLIKYYSATLFFKF